MAGLLACMKRLQLLLAVAAGAEIRNRKKTVSVVALAHIVSSSYRQRQRCPPDHAITRPATL